MKLVYYAHCLTCDFHDDTPQADSRANAHTRKTKHPTVSGARPDATRATRGKLEAGGDAAKGDNAR